VRVTPGKPSPGSLVVLAVRGEFEGVAGEMAGEPLHFRKSGSSWRAIGAVPPDETGSVTATLELRYAGGRTESIVHEVSAASPPPPARGGAPSRLRVADRFSRIDSATQARINRENALARQIGRAAHESPPAFKRSFQLPRNSAVTSRFGTGRVFNGSVASRHLGVDFRGAKGAPVHAANDGVVALVDDFYLAGKVIYVDHGGGLVTGYFHLSEALVAKGDVVRRGQEIGKVGASGRTTGPHLHWNARYGAITVDPMGLVEVLSDSVTQ
jgi:murein DD-endopeptidase MepM/ murein hydrolase activator NlpD